MTIVQHKNLPNTLFFIAIEFESNVQLLHFNQTNELTAGEHTLLRIDIKL